jgi:hypothetical protein
MAKAKEAVIDVTEMVKVELLEYKTGSTHTVYHKLGMTLFEDGVAEVTEDVATVLKEAGLIK